MVRSKLESVASSGRCGVGVARRRSQYLQFWVFPFKNLAFCLFGNYACIINFFNSLFRPIFNCWFMWVPSFDRSSLQWRSRPQSFFLSVYSSSSLVLLSTSFRCPFSANPFLPCHLSILNIWFALYCFFLRMIYLFWLLLHFIMIMGNFLRQTF